MGEGQRGQREVPLLRENEEKIMNVFVVTDWTGEVTGVYSTLDLATKAFADGPTGNDKRLLEFELDKETET